MNPSRSIALVLAAAAACTVVAVVWYERKPGGPTPVQAVTGAPSPVASSTLGPVVFVPGRSATASASPTPAARGSENPAAGSSVVTSPPTAPPLPAGATPGPALLPAPAVTLAPNVKMPGVIRQPPNAPPRIIAMSITTPVVYSGQLVSGTVETSSNVASVEARIGGFAAGMQKVGVGRFQLSYRVPRLPFFLHRTYTIEVIARNTRGDAVTSSLPITVK